MSTSISNSLETSISAKILAICILGAGSFIFGLLPRVIPRAGRLTMLTSVFLCFGAGVLLATSLVHMLPEVRKALPDNAEIALCGGFFLSYLFDEIVHFFFGDAIHSAHSNGNSHSHQNGNQDYGSIEGSENRSLLGRNNDEDHSSGRRSTIIGALGLIIALSIHSLIEGLAIGVQTSQSKILLLLLAVSCHKFVMSFCLGLECCAGTFKSHLASISIFSLGSVAGICLGMLITDIPASWQNIGLPILQAFAAGTLLYITVCEVMPREKAKRPVLIRHNIFGIIQFVSISFGFSFMSLLNFYLNDDE